MRRATLTRFHIVVIVAVISGTAAFVLHNFILLNAVVFALLIVMGFGAAVPQLGFFGNFICFGNNSKKCVALTFDDGPDPRSTPQLLELLRAEGIPASFFCVGKNVAANPALAARIVHEGHLLENHSHAPTRAAQFAAAERRDLRAVEHNRAGSRLNQAVDAANDSRFAGA